jgi:hypothetical protein
VADLTHASLNPQPAGPFCQVGDEQAIALRKLANIFGAAKLKNGKEKLTPQNEVENMHLRVCKPQCHLRGWQANIQIKHPSNRLYHNTQHLIHIEGNRHLTDEKLHHKHLMVWCDEAQDKKNCFKTRWLRLWHRRIIVFLFRPTQKAMTHQPQKLKLFFSQKWRMQ